MKQLFTYIKTFTLCLGLLNISLAPPYVLAQENGVQFPGIVEGEQASSQNATQQQTENSSGESNTDDERTSFVASESAASGAGDNAALIDLVTSMAVGVLAMAMITYKPPTTDMWIAIAGGVIYIYGEISTLKAAREKLDASSFQLKYYEDGTRDNMQVEALKKQKKSYLDLADMMDTKSKIKKVASAAFMAAAAKALINGAKLATASQACATSLIAEAKACQAALSTCPCAGVGDAAALTEQGILINECRPAAEGSVAGKAVVESIDKSHMATIAPSCPVSAAGPCAIKSKFRTMLTQFSPVLGADFVGAGIALVAAVGLGHILEKLGLGPLKGLVAGAFAPLSLVHDKLLVSPKMRAVSFGTLAGLMIYGAKTSEDQAGEMRDNAAKIDKLLNKMNELQDMNTVDLSGGLASSTGTDNFLTPSQSFGTDSPEGENGCPTGGQRDNAGNCKTFDEVVTSANDQAAEQGFGGTPGAVVDSVGQVTNVADSLMNSGGLSGDAFSDFNELSENPNALRDINRQLKERINRKLAEQGEATINFDQEEEELAKKSRQAILESLEKSGESPDSLLAALGPLNGFITDADKEEKEPEQETSSSTASSQSGESEVFKMPEAGAMDFDMDGLGKKSGAKASQLKNDRGEVVVDVDESLDTDGEDIVKNKDVSIFKVISIRYLKSGIPKLIDRD